MIIADNCFLDSINAPVRRIKGRVELFEGSTLLNTFNARDNLKSFTIERTANKNKIFGYGICQKLTVKLRDNDRNISAAKGNRLEAVFGTNCDYIYSTPVFYINDISRNENTNELTLTAYDALYDAANYTFADLDVRAPYSIAEVATACATKLGLPWHAPVQKSLAGTAGSTTVLFSTEYCATETTWPSALKVTLYTPKVQSALTVTSPPVSK